MYKGHPRTSHSPRAGDRTLTESLPPIHARVVARLAAAQVREPKATGARGRAVRVLEMEPGVSDRVRAALSDFAALSMRPATGRALDDPAVCMQARDAALARFSGKELAVPYTAGSRTHTLNELVHMLFDPANPRARADAADFLSPICA